MFPDALTTPRLYLRPIAAADAPTIFASYAQDPEVTRFMTWRPHASLADTQAYVASCLALDPARARVLALVGRHDGRLRGSLHLRWPAPHRMEFGYCLDRACWNAGLMTEALRAVVDRALTEPGLFRVGAVCDVDNPASARVMEKAGLAREGLLRRWMVHPNLSNEPRDCLAYGRAR